MSPNDVEAFYADAMRSWDEVLRYDVDGAINIGYQQGTRMLQVNLHSADGATTLTLSHLVEISSEPGTTTTTPQTAAGGNLNDALNQMGLETKGEAIVSASGADRYEVEGTTLHVYFSASAGLPAGTECIVITAVLGDGESAVAHRDGVATPC